MGEVPKKNNLTFWLVMVGLVLIIVAITALILFFIQGETKISNNRVDPEVTESITCEAEGQSYPFFKYDNSTRKITTIKATFSDDKLDTISLVYMLYYNDENMTKISEAENHAAMNLRFQEEGLGPDALGAKYARLSDGMKMSLYSKASEISSLAAKYFLLNNSTSHNLTSIQNVYQSAGFSCQVKK